MKSESSIGDWLFVVGGIVAIGAYMGYENQAAMLAWLQTVQTPSVSSNVAGSGILAILTQYWGVALFVAVLAIWLVKSALTRTPNVNADDVAGIDYSVPAWVDVKVIE